MWGRHLKAPAARLHSAARALQSGSAPPPARNHVLRTVPAAVQSPAAGVDVEVPQSNASAFIPALPQVGAQLPLQLPPTVPAVGAREEYEAQLVNDAPEQVSRRRVRIFRPSKSAMQAGTNNTKRWRLDFDTLERWENPVMGWSSSADTVQALAMRFDTLDDAKRFAERQGYDVVVDEAHEKIFRTKVYADNFRPITGKIRLIRTK